jgi:hypothetical protein
VTLLRPVSVAFAAMSLIAVAGLGPAMAQGYPGPASPDVQSTYPSAGTNYQPAGTNYQPQERAQLVTNGPQANVENASPDWSARQNVINSHRYERLIATDRAFRDARMQKECNPITDPQLHASCIASFHNRG